MSTRSVCNAPEGYTTLENNHEESKQTQTNLSAVSREACAKSCRASFLKTTLTQGMRTTCERRRIGGSKCTRTHAVRESRTCTATPRIPASREPSRSSLLNQAGAAHVAKRMHATLRAPLRWGRAAPDGASGRPPRQSRLRGPVARPENGAGVRRNWRPRSRPIVASPHAMN